MKRTEVQKVEKDLDALVASGHLERDSEGRYQPTSFGRRMGRRMRTREILKVLGRKKAVTYAGLRHLYELPAIEANLAIAEALEDDLLEIGILFSNEYVRIFYAKSRGNKMRLHATPGEDIDHQGFDPDLLSLLLLIKERTSGQRISSGPTELPASSVQIEQEHLT